MGAGGRKHVAPPPLSRGLIFSLAFFFFAHVFFFPGRQDHIKSGGTGRSHTMGASVALDACRAKLEHLEASSESLC